MSAVVKGSKMLAAAQAYAVAGYSVLPVWWMENAQCACGNRTGCKKGKHPITRNGLKDATTDRRQIFAWWTQHPKANIGIRIPEGQMVLDVDPRHGGDKALADLELKHGPLPATRLVLTGGNGYHHFFTVPSGLNFRPAIGPGLEVKVNSGYVVAIPSNHESGGTYRDGHSTPFLQTPISPAPDWLLTLVLAQGEAAGVSAASSDGSGLATMAKVCGFVCWARENPAEVSEPLWHALASNFARLPGGRPAFHEISRGHPKYTPRETDEKVSRALRGSPPITCARIRELGFTGCPPEGHGVRSPAGLAYGGRIPVLESLADIQPEEVEWLWKGRVAFGMLTLVAGDGATGKTSATLDMACRTTGGGAWPDGGRAPSCDVILISSEDSLRMKVRPFVDAHGGDPHRIQILKSTQLSPDGTGERDFDLENDIKALERAIVETGARVVFISPLSAYLGKKDSYKDAEIRGILRPLSDLADRHRVALVAILHVTKDSDRQFIHRILGSVAFSNQARLVLGCGIDPRAHGQSNFIMASVKNSVGAKPPTLAYRIETRIQRYDDGRAIEVGGLTWDKDPVEGDVNQLLNPKRPMPRHERDEATAFLLETLKDGPVAFKDIERAAQQRGIADRTLKRAKGELGIVAEQPVDTSKRKLPSVWRLPDYA